MAKNRVKSTQQFKEDILFFRMSALFILACMAIIGIFNLDGSALGLSFWRLARNPLYLTVVAILLAVSLVYTIICKKNGKDESEKTFSSANYTSVAAYIFLASLYWGFAEKTSPWVLLAATICLTLLYFIYNIYKKDFFLFSASNFIFLVTIWLFSFSGLFYKVLAAVMLAVSAYCCYYCYSKVKTNSEKGTTVVPVYVSFVIVAALIVFKHFISISYITSGIVTSVMLFQYLIFGIYYTIRLIREA